MYRNTNLLIGKPDWEILVQKTGYTNDAGQCLVMQAMIEERAVVMVFLNSFGKSDAHRGREAHSPVDGGARRAAGCERRRE